MTMISPISSIEQQLAALKLSMAVPPTIPQPVTSSPVTKEDLLIMIKDLLATELSEILESGGPKLKPIEVEPITLEDALTKVLTGDDQAWLLNPENVKRMPEFIISDSGKLITQQFIKEFRGMYGN